MFNMYFDSGAAYELVISIRAYMNKQHHKWLDLGPEWVKGVKAQIPSQLDHKIGEWREKGAFQWNLEFLIWKCPGQKDPVSFSEWLGRLTPGELYELLASRDGQLIPSHLSELRDRCVYVLLDWYTYYFSNVDPNTLERLQADVTQRQAMLASGSLSKRDLVEFATGGLRLNDGSAPEELILIPQYHMSPWNHSSLFQMNARQVCLNLYPVDAFPTAPGEPDAKLLRLTKALSDVSRLRLLHFIQIQPRTFSEVVEFSGLTKGTVHHHLVLLRAAGLVLVHHGAGMDIDAYSVNPRIMDEVTGRIGSFLTRTET